MVVFPARSYCYYLIVQDRTGVLSSSDDSAHKPHAAGGVRPALIYESEDGITWSAPQVACLTNDAYGLGRRERFERPQILWKDGSPEYLFMALKGGRHGTASSAVLRIDETYRSRE